MTGIYDAAGTPDGAFAAIVDYQDLSSPDGVRMKVMLGRLDEANLVAEWVSPWSVLEAVLFHVGWDGEAFAVHAKRNGEAAVVLVRLGPDGSVLTPATAVGAISNFYLGDSAFLTDGESGKSWMVNILSSTTWLSGHERGGTPLAGTEADGGVVLDFYVAMAPALAATSSARAARCCRGARWSPTPPARTAATATSSTSPSCRRRATSRSSGLGSRTTPTAGLG